MFAQIVVDFFYGHRIDVVKNFVQRADSTQVEPTAVDRVGAGSAGFLLRNQTATDLDFQAF